MAGSDLRIFSSTAATPATDEPDIAVRLAGGVAHDLNNILLVLQGYAEMAVEEAESAPGMQSLLGEMRAATSRAASLVKDLLVLGGRGAFTPRLLDLADVVRRRLPFLEASCPPGVELHASVGTDLPPITADEEQVVRMLDALCARSRDSLPTGGTISLHLGVEPGGSRLRLAVADNGTPLTDEMTERLFEPYQPGPGGGKGQGLGMAVVQAVVRRLAGEIAVRARAEGTEIEVLLAAASSPAPALQKDAAAGASERPEVPAARAADANGPSILLAEDDEGLRALAVKVLGREGYTVIPARDGQEAVDLFQANSARIRVVVMDDVMPRLGGRAALEKIHHIAPRVPLILCIGYDWRLTQRASELDAFLHTLPKPWQPRDLLRVVRETLDVAAAAGLERRPSEALP